MTEIMLNTVFTELFFISLSSSVLILAFILISSLAKTRITPIVKYLAWLLILLKLMMPFNFHFSPSVGFDHTQQDGVVVSDTVSHENESYAATDEGNQVYPEDEDKSITTSTDRLNISGFLSDNLTILSYIWFLGFILFLSFKVFSEIVIIKRINDSRTVRDEKLMEVIEMLRQKIRLYRDFRICESGRFNSPAVYGFLKPVLVLPNASEFMELEPEHMKNILFHEMNHIKNNDNFIRLIVSAVTAVYWFNPFVWLFSLSVINSQEMISDSRVLRLLPKERHRKYADLILDLYGEANTNPILKIPAFLSNKSLMRERIMQVLFFKSRKLRITVISMTAAVLIFIASFFLPIPGIAEAYDSALASETMTEADPGTDVLSSPESIPTEKPPTENSSGNLVDDIKSPAPAAQDDYIVFHDPELGKQLSAILKIPHDKITHGMLDSITALEIWGDTVSINQPYMNSIQYFDSDGNATDYDGNIISTAGRIESLRDIEKMRNLRVLSINGNRVSELPDFTHLTDLKTIRLMNNEITDISAFSSLESPVEIYLCKNSISDISPLSQLDTVSVLWLGGNHISEIPDFSAMISLNELRLEKNRLLSIEGLSGVKQLRKLSLGMNSIQDISPLSGLTSLTDLALLSNNISDISALSEITGLHELFINNNRISDLSPITSMKYLIFLNCSGNYIDDLKPLFEMSALQELYFRDNRGSADMSELEKLEWVRNIVTDD